MKAQAKFSPERAKECMTWTEEVTGEDLSSFPDPLYCYSRTDLTSTTSAQYVALQMNMTGVNTSTMNNSIQTALTSEIQNIVSTHLSTMCCNRPNITLTTNDVQVVIQNCDTVAIIITQPVNTNMIPIYESLSFYTHQDNPNWGSKRPALRDAINTAMDPYGINFEANAQNRRSIGHLDSRPSSLGGCTGISEQDDIITISAGQGGHMGMIEQMGVLAVLMLTSMLAFQ